MTSGCAANESRRKFTLGALGTFATPWLGGAALAESERPPEISRIRILRQPAVCLSPEYLAEEMLRLEGFSSIEFLQPENMDSREVLLADLVDISVGTAPDLLPAWEAGKDIVALAPIHGGCWELFANDPVRSVRELKGKRVAVRGVAVGTDYYYLASIAAYIGIDPRRDIHWVEGKSIAATMQLFIDKRADAFVGFPPQPQQLRARKVGRVILNTALDRPWDQYSCCLVTAHRDFVARHPVATKKVLRAIMKAADLCAHEPERAAQLIVAKGYEQSYDVALEVLKSLSYSRWRTHSPDDTFRFHGLRLKEAGLVRADLNKLIARGTDWSFVNELKRELKS